MLLLTLQADESLYALDGGAWWRLCRESTFAGHPPCTGFLAGVFDYRAMIVPVIDLGPPLGSSPRRSLLSTRIVLVDSRPGERKPSRSSICARPWLLGIIAERVSDVVSIKPKGRILRGHAASHDSLPRFFVELDHEMAQLIVRDRVLDEPLRAAFFGAEKKERATSESVSV